MNKRIILSLIAFIVIVGGGIGVREIISYKEVSIVFKQPTLSIDIYASNNKKISSISSDATLNLKVGSYYYTPTSEKYSSEKVFFNVDGIETIEINPSYSDEYLATLFSQQQNAITEVITISYPTIVSDYIIVDEKLSRHGEWFSAKLMQRVSGGNEPDVYRVIMNKEGNSWKITVSPRLVISITEFPKIPEQVIRQVNAPLSNEAYDLLYPR